MIAEPWNEPDACTICEDKVVSVKWTGLGHVEGNIETTGDVHCLLERLIDVLDGHTDRDVKRAKKLLAEAGDVLGMYLDHACGESA